MLLRLGELEQKSQHKDFEQGFRLRKLNCFKTEFISAGLIAPHDIACRNRATKVEACMTQEQSHKIHLNSQNSFIHIIIIEKGVSFSASGQFGDIMAEIQQLMSIVNS